MFIIAIQIASLDKNISSLLKICSFAFWWIEGAL